MAVSIEPERDSLTVAAPAAARALNVWYVHPYAGGPGVGRFSRPFYLAHNWMDQAIRPTIFCPSFHHLLDKPRQPGPVEIDGVTYRFVAARPYHRNGLSRLANMADFTLAMLSGADAFAASYGAPDVVIGSSPHPYIFLATHRIARRFGARSIFEVRDLWPLSLVELAGVHPMHPLVLATGVLERWAYKHADHVVALHPNALPYMRLRGLDVERWSYIPNGIDLDEEARLDADEPAYRQIRRWKEQGRFVVIYTGAFGPPNNLDVLVRVAAQLREEGHDGIRFLLVGRGEVQEELARQIEALSLGEWVKLFPQVPKAHALALMEASDTGYISLKPMPIFRHGISPNKLYDYMLARLPVVSAITAANDPVADAGCGITVPPGDVAAISQALRRLQATGAEELAAMGRRGASYVRSYHDYAELARRYAMLFGGTST